MFIVWIDIAKRSPMVRVIDDGGADCVQALLYPQQLLQL